MSKQRRKYLIKKFDFVPQIREVAKKGSMISKETPSSPELFRILETMIRDIKNSVPLSCFSVNGPHMVRITENGSLEYRYKRENWIYSTLNYEHEALKYFSSDYDTTEQIKELQKITDSVETISPENHARVHEFYFQYPWYGPMTEDEIYDVLKNHKRMLITSVEKHRVVDDVLLLGYCGYLDNSKIATTLMLRYGYEKFMILNEQSFNGEKYVPPNKEAKLLIKTYQ